jgi:hypothetical protein
MRDPHPDLDPAEGSTPKPKWKGLGVAMLTSALLFTLVAPPRTALYWYIFPLFGLGVCYLVQFRAEFPLRWKVAFGASAVVSPLALGLGWAFSGHVLWNALFIGHAWTTGKGRSAWMGLLLASLVYLFAMKVAFQTTSDVVGAFISLAVAAVVLLAIALQARRASTPHETEHRTEGV